MRFRRLIPLLATALLSLYPAGLAQAEPAPEQPAEPQEEAVAAVSQLLEEAEVTLHAGDSIYIALGNSVLKISEASGLPEWRTAVSGQVTLLEEAGSGVSVVTALADGLSERVTLNADGRAGAPIRFGSDPEVLASLRNEAQVQDPEQRLESDPTNPWLYLAAAENATGEQVSGLQEQALATATTFYDLAGLAAEFAGSGNLELADTAMRLALTDFARRGYDPGLLTDPELHATYGLPVPQLQAAMDSGDAEAARFWAGWTEAFLSPNVPQVADALHDYSAWLAERGETEAAADWQQRARPGWSEIAMTGVERLFTSIGKSGWYMFASLVVVILALQATLTFKYWDPQTLAMRRSLETGGKAGFGQRLLAIRFFSTTEKLVLALLYVAGLAVLGLTGWTDRSAAVPPALGAGTLAGAEAQDALAELQLSGERGQFIQGYAAQAAGDEAAAGLHYRAAPRFGPALNNLAVLTGSEELLEEAAHQAPSLQQVAWNQGQAEAQPVFDRLAGLDRPALVVPGPLDFTVAQRGSWQQAMGSYFTQPLQAFNLRADWLPAQWLWYLILAVYLLLGVITLLWFFVPRPRMARNAPRSPAYHLLALLVPGSGMADEVWGLLLLLPWGLLGVDLVWRLSGAGALLDLPQSTVVITLAILYALNLAAFIVEFSSYRRRMRQLFQTSPEAGIAYGRRISPTTQQG